MTALTRLRRLGAGVVGAGGALWPSTSRASAEVLAPSRSRRRSDRPSSPLAAGRTGGSSVSSSGDLWTPFVWPFSYVPLPGDAPLPDSRSSTASGGVQAPVAGATRRRAAGGG